MAREADPRLLGALPVGVGEAEVGVGRQRLRVIGIRLEDVLPSNRPGRR